VATLSHLLSTTLLKAVARSILRTIRASSAVFTHSPRQRLEHIASSIRPLGPQHQAHPMELLLRCLLHLHLYDASVLQGWLNP